MWEIVGPIVSDHPLTELDGVPLGPNYWKVYVLKANKPAAHLEKTCQGVCIIGEVWTKHCLAFFGCK